MISSLKKTGNKFSATLDEWTSLKNVRFINVNIHFIEKESKRFINLGMVRIKGAATSEAISGMVSKSHKLVTVKNNLSIF